jgi:hypothetical protein
VSDLIYVIATVGFFAAAAGYVWLCERLIGQNGSDLAEFEDGTAS